MSKIKIIHVVHDFLRGGIESFLYYLVKEQLSDPNLEVSILCCQDEEKVLNKRILNLDVAIHYIKIRPFEKNVNKYVEVLKLVNKFDIIHYQTFLPGLFYFLSISKPKKMITVHSSGTYNRQSTLFSKIKQKLFGLFMSHFCDAVVNNSKFTKKFWEQLGVSNKNNFVVYNGVNFSDNSDVNRAIADFPELANKKIIGTTSRLIEWKRVDSLLKTFIAIAPSLPEDCVLMVVGDGDQRSKLEKMAKDSEFSNRIYFVGYKPNVKDYQELIDVCVFASIEEPFGLVAIECLNLGKPVFVMHDGGGLVEIMNGISEEYVAKSFSDLGDLLVRSISNSGLVNAARNIDYSKRFSTRIAAKNYLDIYKTI